MLLQWKRLEKASYLTLGTVAIIALVVSLISGCAPPEYRKQQFSVQANSAGVRFIPAKIDIVFVPDNSASLNMALNTVQGQLASFTNELKGMYWDYHVARSLMINPSPINQVLVNPQFNVDHLPDGTLIPTTGIVPSDRAINDPNAFPILDGTVASGSGDYTYLNTYNTINASRADTVTNFFRDDAMLAIIVITNGAEVSVDPMHTGAVNTSVLSTHATNLKNLKGGDSRLIRFYPVAAYGYKSGGGTDYCLTPGSSSYIGTSYFRMNDYIQGLPQFSGGQEVLNFCNSYSLSNVLGDIAQNLEIIKQSYVYSNIVLDDEPIPSTIHVSKNGTELAQSPSNGWTYMGFGTVYTITGFVDPNTGIIQNITPGLNRRTGYVIQLNGNARMVGSDTPNVVFEKQ